MDKFAAQERERVLGLIRKIGRSTALLIFCVENGYCVTELDTARQRFAEQPDEDAQELM